MLNPEEPWGTGLFGCCSDIGVCCFGFWCLPCLYGKNASRIRGTSCSGPGCCYALCPCLTCMFAGTLRGEIRTKYKLPADPCVDCCVHLCCSPLAVCQEAREIKHRGVAPAGAYTFSDPQLTAPMRQNMA
ncbi:hypothetical protein ABBQ32_013979 [Trebouxia sp. C0010 RCD-2024]